MTESNLEKTYSQTAATETHVENHAAGKIQDDGDLHMNNDLAYKGDDSDGKVDWTLRSKFAAASLCGLYVGKSTADDVVLPGRASNTNALTGSQIMLYFVGGSLGYISAELGIATRSSWLPVANTLAITAVAPFVGYLQDLLGRRNITLFGSVIIIVGIALVGSAHNFGQAVSGMAISGSGAGICELTALAGYVMKITEYSLLFLGCLHQLASPISFLFESEELSWPL